MSEVFEWRVPPKLREHVEFPDGTEPEANVPCGTCRLCCKGRSAVLVQEDYGDDVASYETFELPVPGREHARFLKLQPNGDCIYLGESGCTIHGRAPYICRVFDCRAQHAMYTKAQRESLVRAKILDPAILRRGATLLHQATKAGVTA